MDDATSNIRLRRLAERLVGMPYDGTSVKALTSADDRVNDFPAQFLLEDGREVRIPRSEWRSRVTAWRGYYHPPRRL